MRPEQMPNSQTSKRGHVISLPENVAPISPAALPPWPYRCLFPPPYDFGALPISAVRLSRFWAISLGQSNPSQRDGQTGTVVAAGRVVQARRVPEKDGCRGVGWAWGDGSPISHAPPVLPDRRR